MSVVPEKESLKDERERLVVHTSTLQGQLSTMQSRIQEIDLELEGGEGGGKGGEKIARETSLSQSPQRSVRPSIQAKAKALVDLVVNADASSETIFLMRAIEEAKVIDSRDNIAKLIGGPAPAFVNVVRRPVGYILSLLWLVGSVSGLLSFIKVLDDWVSIVSPFLATPMLLYMTLRMNRYTIIVW